MTNDGPTKAEMDAILARLGGVLPCCGYAGMVGWCPSTYRDPGDGTPGSGLIREGDSILWMCFGCRIVEARCSPRDR